MKKRVLLQVIVISCLVFTGCGSTESENTATVLEIPIEETYENAEGTESMAQEVVSETVEEESIVFEEIDVEVNGDKGAILVGTTGTPFTELLTQAKINLAKEGWDLQIKYYDNYEQLNQDVLNGVLDAHLFAHQTYIDSYNNVNKSKLCSVIPVCHEVYGVYSKLDSDLTQITDATVALPQEAEKKARALLFMHDIGWITLAEGVGMTAITEDIVTNDRNLQFTEYTQDTLARAMDENDYCIIGADSAIVGGLSVEDDAIRTETKNGLSAGIYATILVTTPDRAEDIKLQTLADALASDTMKEYVSDTYEGALELMR